MEFNAVDLDGRQTADARTDDDTGALGVFSRRRNPAGITNRFISSSDCVRG